jgi:uncharacterized protein YqgC (DUF456 family)
VTVLEIVAFTLAVLVMMVGIIGCVVPMIPGTPLIFAAAIVHRLVMGDAGAQWWVLCILGLLAMLSFGAEYAASFYGAKTLGATKRGMIGAVVGGLVGLFFGIIGILIGPFVGAFSFEFIGGREWRDSARAGVGATLGLAVGAGGKIACAMAMLLLFSADILWRGLTVPA